VVGWPVAGCQERRRPLPLRLGTDEVHEQPPRGAEREARDGHARGGVRGGPVAGVEPGHGQNDGHTRTRPGYYHEDNRRRRASVI
jgi:hypothetical protein